MDRTEPKGQNQAEDSGEKFALRRTHVCLSCCKEYHKAGTFQQYQEAMK